MISVMRRVFDVKNLTASALLSSTGKTFKFESDEVKDRTEIITLFQFDCNIDPSSQDSCIV